MEKKTILDDIYETYNKQEFIAPDPLQFLSSYDDILDREIAGFICAGLAYGRVEQICKSISRVLTPLGASPRKFLEQTSVEGLRKYYRGFKHRFTTGEELSDFLMAIREIIREHGSLQACFLRGMRTGDRDTTRALSLFIQEIRKRTAGGSNSLLPCPEKKSACKRYHLYLRWMVRHDDVDPGGWHAVDASFLVVPLDIHMYRIGVALDMTTRRQADLRTALEITEIFREISPGDPVRYDFALTRIGIHGKPEGAMLLQKLANSVRRN